MKATLHKCEWMMKGVMANITEEEIELPEKDRLKFLQKLVGGLIDVVHHNGRDLVINDEGLLLGLPLNPWAKAKGYDLVGNVVEIHGVLE